MLTAAGCQSRREHLWKRVPPEVDWVLVADPRHVHYLCNFWVQPLSFSYSERGLLLLSRDAQAILLADNFAFRSAATEPHIDQEILFPWYDHQRSTINRDHALLNALKQAAPQLKGTTVLVESEWAPVAVLDRLKDCQVMLDSSVDRPTDAVTSDLGTLLRTLRRQKEPDEIELLMACMKAGDAGQARLREVLKPGMSDLDIFREIQAASLTAAGRACLIYGDFRLANKEHPKQGGLPQNETLQEGDTFILDYSVMLDGYRSDFTNTLSVGKPSPELQELFGLCQAGMAAGEEQLKAGTPAAEVYAAVAGPFREAGRAEAFPHHAGHGLGLAHPEWPILVPDSDDVLLAGDVVTLEPGAYVEGIGGMRIEHNYLVTERGYERLSNHQISLT